MTAGAPRLERALLLGGLMLVALHLLDLALSGPETTLVGGPARPMDAREAREPPLVERAVGALSLQAVRGISGMREAPSLLGLMPLIGPRPVLLIAGGVGVPDELPTNELYRDAGGPTTQLWKLPDTGHTAGLRTHPVEYERRTTGFLDRALSR